ncbi:gluconate 2-dehydrogenase subunit 3 family protein [Microbacterium chocolatum]|uniref:gluconate 2-dehydrogenase subunit 3 family protein n=1 Tax=Microbacterium aurantiacum TaxID=162393 RepID=UPI00338D7178
MTSKSEWQKLDLRIDPDSEERLFFSEHEWETIEAAAARIIPTDHDPGAREARVIVFIDRYLSGIDYIYAAADGSGFLQLAGAEANAARARNAVFQRMYRDGVVELDRLARQYGADDFARADEETQDSVLVELSGAPKPVHVRLDEHAVFYSRLQGNTDQGKPFFETLCLHVRQGFYSDPVYGGNKDRVGWKVIGFPGPESLKDTMDGSYTTAPYFAEKWDWSDLLLHYEPLQ